MKKSVLAIIILVLTGFNVSGGETNEIALVMKCRGLVSVSYQNGGSHAMVSKGYLVMPGAQLQTGSSGFAVVKFISSRSVVIIRPRTEVVCNAFMEGKGVNESVEMKAGEMLLDVMQPHKHSFDLHTASCLVSFQGDAKTLVILSKGDQGTALYNLEGSAQIADNNFTLWRALGAETVAFAAQNGFVQISALSKNTIPRLRDIFESTRKLTSGPSLVHDLIIKAGRNGSVEPAGKLVALSGVDIDISAQTEPEYTFTGWNIVDGNAHINDITAPQTRVSVLSNTLIEALFEEKPAILKIVQSTNGATEPSGDIPVQKGTPVQIRVAPKEGYEFAGFKTSSNIKIDDSEPLKAQITLLAKRGKIMAKFVKKSYQLTIKKGDNGTVTPKGKLTAGHGDSIVLSAVPGEGFQFIRWEIVDGFTRISNPHMAQTSCISDSIDATVEALFSDNAVEVSLLQHDLAEMEPAGNFFVIRNSLFSVMVKPDTGKMVSRWIVTRGKARVQGTNHAVIKCKTPFEIKPVITEQEFDLTLLGDHNGTVIPKGTKTVFYKRPFTIMAKPNLGMHFIRWKLSGGWADIADPQKDSTQVSLTRGDAVVKAEFAETICTLNVASTHGGYTEPSGIVNNYEGGDVIVQAISNPKAAFVGWEVADSGDNVLFSDTITVAEQTLTSVTGNASIRAVFSTETVEMAVLTNGFGVTVPEGKFYAVQNKWISLKALPNKDQKFVQWTAIAGSNVQFKDPLSPETEVNSGSEALVVKALFQSSSSLVDGQSGSDTVNTPTPQKEFTLRIECDKGKGSVDQDEEITVTSGVGIVITATSKEGYTLDKWHTLKGSALFSDRYDPTTTVVLTKEDAIITPLFKLKTLHTLEIKFKDYEGRTKTLMSTYR